MSRLLPLLLLALLPAQDPEGLVIDRKVRLTYRDTVDRVREIHRLERIKFRDGRLLVEDLTFGTKLIIRGDLRTVTVADPMSGHFSELSFERVAALKSAAIAGIRQARDRVAGSTDEERILFLLQGLGDFPAPPKVEVRTTDRKETVAGRDCSGRELIVNGDIHYIDVVVDPSVTEAPAALALLASAGAWPPEIASAIQGLGGLPLKGTMRYSLFLDRVTSDEEVTAIRRGPVADADFEIPPGLKRVPLRGFEPEQSARPEKPKDFERSYKEDDVDRENNPLNTEPPKEGEKPK